VLEGYSSPQEACAPQIECGAGGTTSVPNDLLAALGSEIQAYRRLLVLTTRERDALRRGDLAEVAAVVRDKGSLMHSLAEQETTRSYLTADLATAVGLPTEASLQDLIGHVDEPHAQGLRVMRQECLALVDQLQLLNRGNCGLIQTRLDRIDATLDFLSRSAIESDGHYTPHGNSTTPSHTGHVLNWQI